MDSIISFMDNKRETIGGKGVTSGEVVEARNIIYIVS